MMARMCVDVVCVIRCPCPCTHSFGSCSATLCEFRFGLSSKHIFMARKHRASGAWRRAPGGQPRASGGKRRVSGTKRRASGGKRRAKLSPEELKKFKKLWAIHEAEKVAKHMSMTLERVRYIKRRIDEGKEKSLCGAEIENRATTGQFLRLLVMDRLCRDGASGTAKIIRQKLSGCREASVLIRPVSGRLFGLVVPQYQGVFSGTRS